MKKMCPTCSEPVIGRTDKKFCSDQCRNDFNNRVKRKTEANIININKKLRKNRKILSQLNPQGKTTVRKFILEKLDFDFNYHTHLYTTENGNTYFFCYEFGYMVIENDIKVLIVNEQKYMKP